MTNRDEKTWGTLVHLGGLIGMFVIPLAGNIIGAVVFWLIKRNESAFVDDQGREAVNFQITISLISVLLSFILWITWGLWHFAYWGFGGDNFGPSFFRPHFIHFSIGGGSGIIWIINVVFSLIAAYRANNGIAYRYPVSFRIVK